MFEVVDRIDDACAHFGSAEVIAEDGPEHPQALFDVCLFVAAGVVDNEIFNRDTTVARFGILQIRYEILIVVAAANHFVQRSQGFIPFGSGLVDEDLVGLTIIPDQVACDIVYIAEVFLEVCFLVVDVDGFVVDDHSFIHHNLLKNIVFETNDMY